jgi:HEAT repeats
LFFVFTEALNRGFQTATFFSLLEASRQAPSSVSGFPVGAGESVGVWIPAVGVGGCLDSRRFERAGPDTRSLPELVKQLEHNHDAVRLLAIKFLALAGPSAKEAIPALDRMREDPNAEVRKQAQAASDRIKSKAESSQDNGNARKTASP